MSSVPTMPSVSRGKRLEEFAAAVRIVRSPTAGTTGYLRRIRAERRTHALDVGHVGEALVRRDLRQRLDAAAFGVP